MLNRKVFRIHLLRKLPTPSLFDSCFRLGLWKTCRMKTVPITTLTCNSQGTQPLHTASKEQVRIANNRCSTMTSPFLDNSSSLESKAEHSRRGSNSSDSTMPGPVGQSNQLITAPYVQQVSKERRKARISAYFSITYLCARCTNR
jgi:hypothetical protein